jgi:hypothetical protein
VKAKKPGENAAKPVATICIIIPSLYTLLHIIMGMSVNIMWRGIISKQFTYSFSHPIGVKIELSNLQLEPLPKQTCMQPTNLYPSKLAARTFSTLGYVGATDSLCK